VQARTLRINHRLTKLGEAAVMPDYRPPLAHGFHVFFTVALANRGSRALVDHIDLLRRAAAQTRAERPFTIDAWVVLPDHLHCVWTLPAGDADYPTRWRLIKTSFSRHLPSGPLRPSHVKRGERGIWQRRYWEHHIRDEADLAAHIRYCWINPVKHGFVQRPEDWPYSSVHRDIAQGSYDPNSAGQFMIP
jgi:putative transposase